MKKLAKGKISDSASTIAGRRLAQRRWQKNTESDEAEHTATSGADLRSPKELRSRPPRLDPKGDGHGAGRNVATRESRCPRTARSAEPVVWTPPGGRGRLPPAERTAKAPGESGRSSSRARETGTRKGGTSRPSKKR